MSAKSFISVAAFAVVASLAVSTASAQITIPTVTIGNPGNAVDPFTATDPTTGYGSVSYTYNIGKFEVTNAQYAEFLNAKAASDPYGLYNSNMDIFSSLFGGINRSGSSGSYTYSTHSGQENHPVNWVSFWDACRFANWLHNGQGSGDTETGAYTLGGVTNPSPIGFTRNAGWQWAVTSEDEWYKAAYHQPASAGGDADNYWLFTTSSNSVPSFQANYRLIGNSLPVGSYAANYYGTFDMGGNVWERIESTTSQHRYMRGGAFNSGDDLYLRSDARFINFPNNENFAVGFRVVQKPPLCTADFNVDGTVDFFDYLDFVAAFASNAQGADFNADTVVDFFDYLDFVAVFAAGC